MAYVLGFFAADGYITLNNRGGEFWSIQITDKKLLESIKKVIDAEHKIGIRLPRKINESILYRLQIGSKEMCNDLRKLGFPEKKTKNLAIPNIPDQYFSDFTRGYFDGDGNVWMGYIHKDRNKKIYNLTIQTVFTSCSFDFLKQFHLKLNDQGLKGGSLQQSRTSQGNYSRLKFSVEDSLKLYDFMYNSNIRDFLGLFLNRKKRIFEKFKKLRS